MPEPTSYRPKWVKPGEQWYGGQTQEQYEKSGGILAPGVASVLKTPTPTPAGTPIATPTPTPAITETPKTKWINNELYIWSGGVNTPGYWSPTGQKQSKEAGAIMPSSYTGVSIVDYLKSVNQPSDYTSRSQLAQKYGIQNYTGTAEQNTNLLNILRGSVNKAPSVSDLGKTGMNIDISANPNVVQPPTNQISSQMAAIQSQIDTITKQITEKTAELSKVQAAGYSGSEPVRYDAQGNIIPKTTQTPSMWEKLMGKQEEITTKLGNVPSAEEITNQALAKWGLTPETFSKMNNLAAQVGQINKQIADVQGREDQAILNNEMRTGADLAFMNRESLRISRNYAIQKSTLAAQASAIGTELAALQGNWTQARQMAELTISAALTERKQIIDDLKWSFDTYKDLFIAMEESERDIWKTTLAYQDKQLKELQDELNYVGDLAADPKTAGAFTGIDWSTLSRSEANDLVNQYVQTPAYLSRVAQIEAAQRKPEEGISTGATYYDEFLSEQLKTGASASQATNIFIGSIGENLTEKEKQAIYSRAVELEKQMKTETPTAPTTAQPTSKIETRITELKRIFAGLPEGNIRTQLKQDGFTEGEITNSSVGSTWQKASGFLTGIYKTLFK